MLAATVLIFGSTWCRNLKIFLHEVYFSHLYTSNLPLHETVPIATTNTRHLAVITKVYFDV